MHQPQLITERLLLRSLQQDDDTAIFNIRSDKEVNKYLGRPPATSIEDARDFISKISSSTADHKSFYWVITKRNEPQLIGTICIWNLSDDDKTGEIGYELHPAHHGKGIMAEALGAVVEFAFKTKGMEMLEAFTHKDNLASTRLLLKRGFVLQPHRKDPDDENLIVYALCNKP